MTTYTDLTPNQQRVYLDIEQIYRAYLDVQRQAQEYAGWYVWKNVRGNQYLFHARDREGGKGKGLGRRSPETEALKEQFDAEKARRNELLAQMKTRLDEHAIAARAYKLRRVPTIAAKVIREIDDRGLLGPALIVIGTNALFAYEAAGGTQFFPDYTATRDLDILWEARKGIEFSTQERIEPDGFLGILKSVDKLFTRNEERTFQAVGRDGYFVDLLKPKGASVDRMSPGDKIDPMEIEGQQWLLDCPRFEQVAVADDGYPVRMVCPDPRVFVLHKLWLADQPSRNTQKVRRDRLQAQAVGELLFARLPHLRFEEIEPTLPGELKAYLPNVREFKAPNGSTK